MIWSRTDGDVGGAPDAVGRRLGHARRAGGGRGVDGRPGADGQAGRRAAAQRAADPARRQGPARRGRGRRGVRRAVGGVRVQRADARAPRFAPRQRVGIDWRAGGQRDLAHREPSLPRRLRHRPAGDRHPRGAGRGRAGLAGGGAGCVGALDRGWRRPTVGGDARLHRGRLRGVFRPAARRTRWCRRCAGSTGQCAPIRCREGRRTGQRNGQHARCRCRRRHARLRALPRAGRGARGRARAGGAQCLSREPPAGAPRPGAGAWYGGALVSSGGR